MPLKYKIDMVHGNVMYIIYIKEIRKMYTLLNKNLCSYIYIITR